MNLFPDTGRVGARGARCKIATGVGELNKNFVDGGGSRVLSFRRSLSTLTGTTDGPFVVSLTP